MIYQQFGGHMARIFIIFTLLLFTVIGIAALKKGKKGQEIREFSSQPVEIVLEEEPSPATEPKTVQTQHIPEQEDLPRSSQGLPTADRIDELFNTGEPKLPIVKTITYKSHVPWHEGKLAWISDYANHYETSRHFIARSLNGKPEYNKQDIIDGQNFNIFDPEKDVQFHLVIDASRCKMWFYAVDKSDKRSYLLKTYDVGLGRLNSTKASGLLTPLGVYQLGSRVAIYKPRVMGYHHGNKVEMIQIFGTRWIPFEKEVKDTTAPARGFGIHGIPWNRDENDRLAELRDSIKTYDSDGCIRLLTEDIEEIFAVVITKPTTIEIVNDFNAAKYLKEIEKNG